MPKGNLMESQNNHLSLNEVCNKLNISLATGRNWIKLGKLKPLSSDIPYMFDKTYIEKISFELLSESSSKLKNRRNKKMSSGKSLYHDYIDSAENIDIIQSILPNLSFKIKENELREILANFAIQLYLQKNNITADGNVLHSFKDRTDIDDTFKLLIIDLLQNHSKFCGNKKILPLLNTTLKYHPYQDILGLAYISLRDIGNRKSKGAYFTPYKVVKSLISEVSSNCKIKQKKILDPCCGTGNFIINMIESGISPNYLFGYDNDSISITIARINVFLCDNTVTLQNLYSNFKCVDTLKYTPNEQFDIIIGNPPWGYDFSIEEKKYNSKHFICGKSKSVDSFDLFLEKSLQIIKEDGYIAFVLPESITNVSSHSTIRGIISDSCKFKFVHYLGEVFHKVNCPSIFLCIQKSDGAKSKCLVSDKTSTYYINHSRLWGVSEWYFNVTDSEFDCIRHIKRLKNTKSLKNNAEFALGIVTGDNNKFISSRLEEGHEVILKGSNIYKYGIKQGEQFIKFSPESFQQVAPTHLYRSSPKLIYRFISSALIFTYDDKQTLTLNSANIVIPKISGLDCKYILAILNSRASQFYTKKLYNSVKVLRSHIESIPIPYADIKTQNDIIALVDKLLLNPTNKLELYEKLDKKIMEIFSLSDEHISTIYESLKSSNLFLQ